MHTFYTLTGWFIGTVTIARFGYWLLSGGR